MNDFDPSLDEIVSAYVDGVATPDECARVESDPVLVERAAAFRRVQASLATPSAPADDELRRTLIARALAETTVARATVHPIRSRRSATLGPIVAAAAVIAMFFGVGTWLVASQDNGAGDASTAASSAEDSFNADSQLRAAAATTTAAASASGGAEPQTVAPTAESAKGAPTYLGGFADETALRQALLRARGQLLDGVPTTAPTSTTTLQATCPRTDPADASIYTAELRGRPVTVVVTGTRADVFDNATCAGTTLDLTNR